MSVRAPCRRRTFLACLALLGLCAQAGCQAPVCTVQPVATLPLIDEPSGLYVQATIDGRALKLLLDTGSPRTLLTSETARALGLSIEHLLDDTDVLDGYAVTGVGGRRHIDRAWPRRIELGQAPIIATPVSIVWSGNTDWDPAGDGILGMDILAIYDLDLDVPNRRLSLYAPGALCPSPAGQANPLRVLGDMSSGPWTTVRVGGRTFNALLDTGAQRSFIMANAAAQLGPAARPLPTDPRFEVIGVGSAHAPAVLHGFDHVGLGRVVIPRLPMAMVDGPGESGVILGEDVLRLVRVWILTSSRALYVAAK